MKPKKVVYEYIANERARKAYLKKRKPSLIKKVEQLSILCGVRACLVIYSPNEAEPVFWPSHPEVVNIIRHYLQVPEIEKSRKKVNQESYMKDKVKKLEDQVKQLWSRNREMEVHHYMRQIRLGGKTLNEFSPMELDKLVGYAEEKLRMIQRKRQPHAAAAPPAAAAPNVPSSSTLGKGKGQMQENPRFATLDPWFTKMKNPHGSHSGQGSSSGHAILIQPRDFGPASFGISPNLNPYPNPNPNPYGDVVAAGNNDVNNAFDAMYGWNNVGSAKIDGNRLMMDPYGGALNAGNSANDPFGMNQVHQNSPQVIGVGASFGGSTSIMGLQHHHHETANVDNGTRVSIPEQGGSSSNNGGNGPAGHIMTMPFPGEAGGNDTVAGAGVPSPPSGNSTGGGELYDALAPYYKNF